MKTGLKYVKIFFGTPIFDRIIKDKSSSFVDKLSAVGGTMGLLTGFSIISGVELIFFLIRSVDIVAFSPFINYPIFSKGWSAPSGLKEPTFGLQSNPNLKTVKG